MQYSNWKLRKRIMGESHLSISQRFYALVIIDNVDWSTGQKSFASRKHLANWFIRLAEVNGISEDELDRTLTAMKDIGIADMDGFTLILSSDDNG